MDRYVVILEACDTRQQFEFECDAFDEADAGEIAEKQYCNALVLDVYALSLFPINRTRQAIYA